MFSVRYEQFLNIVAYRPLLGKDLEINCETTPVAMQGRGKHASTTTVTAGNGVFYSVRTKGL
jgi:hypothetical protein